MPHLTLLASIAFAGWVIALVCLVPSLLRSFTKAALTGDEWRAVVFFCGLVFLLFNGRRLFAAGNEQLLPHLYMLSILLVTYVLVLLYRRWKH